MGMCYLECPPGTEKYEEGGFFCRPIEIVCDPPCNTPSQYCMLGICYDLCPFPGFIF
jgi:predicted amidohydrolase